VGLYDTLKAIIQGKESADRIAPVHAEVLDIEEHMLHFLENHDEQRIASDAFAGDANRGRPAMVVSALLSRSPTMIYFAQEVGEPGDGDAGFGDPTRTTIFDYWGVPSHQRWMNGGKFDGGALSDEERALRDFYERLLILSATNAAMRGEYVEIHSANRVGNDGCSDRLFSFVRWQGNERLIVVANFDSQKSCEPDMTLPPHIVDRWQLESGRHVLHELLYGGNNNHLDVSDGAATFDVRLGPLESLVYRVGRSAVPRP
jgi:glycosidase